MKLAFSIKASLTSMALLCTAAAVNSQQLVSEGPAPFAGGQSEAQNESQVGAVNAIAAHPTNADILYIGSVNGGVWRSTDATNANPTWTPLTDDQASLSILDLAFDPTDATAQTLIAGIGRTSSLGSIGGARTGLLMTTDGGDTWTAVDGGLAGSNISGVAPRGNTIVVSADNNDGGPTCDGIGIFRSTDGGTTFTQVTNGISGGSVDALTGDPTDNATLYASIVLATSMCGGTTGIYRSTDTGASWTKVSNAAMDALLADAIGTHVEIAVGNSDNVYVAIAAGGTLDGIFRSGDGGDTFTALDIPGTLEPDNFFGIHPGGQAGIHMSIAADPNDANVVYIGGDRQPSSNNDASTGPVAFPNSIGATTFSGRLFRGDASQASGSQWTPLTHVGTANNSGVHADSRDMMFDANGNLLEADDGGVYRRTSPQNATGDWFSLNAGLQTTELHSAAYDSNSDILGGGSQDNSQGSQASTANTTWNVLLSGDGGDFIVDTQSLAGSNQSVRYTSAQNLQAFVRVVRNADNTLDSFALPTLTVVNGDVNTAGQFVTPTAVNTQNGNRVVIGFANSVYESFDQGDTISELNPPGTTAFGLGLESIVAGGPGNEELLYVAAGGDLFRRRNAGEDMVSVFTSTNTLALVNQDQEDITQAFFAEVFGGVFRTQNTGDSWTDVSGNLPSFNAGRLLALTHMSNPFAARGGLDNNMDAIVVGTDRGVFVASEASGFTQWTRLSADIPNAPVFGLEYDADINELFISTLGRGTFSYGPVFEEFIDPDVIFSNGFE